MESSIKMEAAGKHRVTETVTGSLKVWPGNCYPLGATWDGKGVNFAIYSGHAEKIELCLFDSPNAEKESRRIPLPENTNWIWHGYIPGLKPGQLYGYRVYGPYAPARSGHRFNPHKIVLDPYAKAIGRDVIIRDELFGYKMTGHRKDLACDTKDNAAWAPLAMVIDPHFDWGEDPKVRIPWHDTVIYELHVKGFTKLFSKIPEDLRGTYAGLASDEAIRYLKDLGVTTVELMPVHHSVNDKHLSDKGLTNYWGYNTLSYFAPHLQYASHPNRHPQHAIHEFKGMVKALHRAGIEVILDVVYNHTAEGNQMGPTLSFRGVDNASYYRLMPKKPRFYEDFTGCGNTLNMRHPRVLQLITDSLRYWLIEMHVDGFRFDLASALARELYEVDKLSGFFDVIHQDPVINQAKLIAEPWDIGAGGYQVGNFPVGWAEWNGKYRDSVRSFWKGDGGIISEFATRLCGSSDLYEQSGRRPYASINYVTSHDGFTLQDLVSYDRKHNENNGDENRDGDNHNLSWNCGTEGETQDEKILLLREKQKKNLIATLMLSQGVPMLSGGDELSRTQHGNNNAYCQDNGISWYAWDLDAREKSFLEFVRSMIRFRREQPVLRRKKFFQGRDLRGVGVKDIAWLEPSGQEMTDEAWNTHFVRCLGMLLSGDVMGEVDERGEAIRGDTLMVLLNGHHDRIEFHLPQGKFGHVWQLAFDTGTETPPQHRYNPGETYELKGRSLAVLRAVVD